MQILKFNTNSKNLVKSEMVKLLKFSKLCTRKIYFFYERQVANIIDFRIDCYIFHRKLKKNLLIHSRVNLGLVTPD